jgi:hypothetical protein
MFPFITSIAALALFAGGCFGVSVVFNGVIYLAGAALWFTSLFFMWFVGFIAYAIVFLCNIPIYISRIPEFVLTVLLVFRDLPSLWADISAFVQSALDFSLLTFSSELMKCDPPSTLFFFFRQPQSAYCTVYNQYYDVKPIIGQADATIVAMIILVLFGFLCFRGSISFVHVLRETIMPVLVCMSRSYHLKTSTLRESFGKKDLLPVKPAEHHIYGESAADRTSATNFASQLAFGVGLDAYFV